MELKSEIRNFSYVIAGALALAMGIVLFLAPNRVATGGTPGMAILINYLISLPIGSLMLLINIPLLIISTKILGRLFALRSVVAIFITSIFTDLFAEVFHLQALSQNILLATLYGGIAVGAGVGLILRGHASAGGTTIIARLIAARSQYKPGQIVFIFDILIVVASGFVFVDIERALWSMISIYTTGKCIDIILTGTPSEKIVHITTNKIALLSQEIIKHLGQQGTILTGTGLYENEKKTMIFVTVEARQITVLRDIIRNNDAEAFMVVMDAAEMLGRGHGG
ncbi:YitT family protein [uncultured Desulfuromusa sp.]|uniref:YitT family protein n=1 Tax=uncultured Desulfuromusa sp. TaxID=219183 RepID=UPI002AA723CB|nr:YitT family protein [uncultured Desulfuromusa sp.]